MAGANGHQPDCGCPLCRGKVRTAERERAEAEQAQTRKDAAWAVVMGSGGPDAVLSLAMQHGDPQRAYRLLQAAGLDADGIASRHRAEAPHAVQRSSSGSPWAADPEHDPEALRLLNGPGGTAAYRAKVDELTEARQQERQARQQQPGVMWRTRGGGLVSDGQAAVMGASFGGSGAPVQRSIVHTSVPEIGTE